MISRVNSANAEVQSKPLPTNRPPIDVMTQHEVRSVLDAAQECPRDYMLLSLALGTGLRVSELCALNIGDLYNPSGTAKMHLRLRPETTKRKRGGTIAINGKLQAKLLAYEAWKIHIAKESMDADAPLFMSQEGRRIAVRTAQYTFEKWQRAAGLRRHHKFHAMRHTFCTNVWRISHDLKIVQVAARHSNIANTAIYTHPTLDDLAEAVANVEC